VDKSWLASAVFGGALVVTGLLMMRSHARVWQEQKDDSELEDKDRLFLRRRYRRRMQASGLLTIIGVMLPVGDSIRLFLPAPEWFALYWIVVLLLVMWVFVLAIGDMASTKTHTTVALNRIRAQQRELEREAAALRGRRSNGQGRAHGPASSTGDDQ